MSALSRRKLLVGGAGVAGIAGAYAVGRNGFSAGESPVHAAGDVVEFYGEHQAGITTPAQDRLFFAAFDVTSDDLGAVRSMLQEWTRMAAQMTKGIPAGEFGAVDGPLQAPPEDTGEALGLAASSLTLTFGFGATFFERDGVDRFGLADRRPRALIDLPHFPADNLDPALSGGDVCVQACANDPQVAFHAVRNLARAAFGVAAVRWTQLGFGRTSSTSTQQATPRNLFGFKDGTANIKSEEADSIDQHVWARASDGASWMDGGTYVVTRRIAMHIEPWDRTPLFDQENIIGRSKGTGAPLSGGDEVSAPQFGMVGANDEPIIPTESHITLAHPSNHGGARMLRRGYNFTDGNDGLGRLDAGLFFIAFVRDPLTQFVPVQQALSKSDVMMEYIQHRSSAIFAVPPGVRDGQSIAHTLFD